MSSSKKIVTIGGGTGQPELLRGLRSLNEPVELTAIVTTIDNGGSSGVLCSEYDVLPPGDLRRCIAALSSLSQPIDEWWNYRFAGGSLDGHTVGNVVLAGMQSQSGDIHAALEQVQQVFACVGRVLPVTIDHTELCARLEDGQVIRGETNIDIPQHDARLHIQELFLSSPVECTSQVQQAIAEADVIVLSPGDLFTSIIANLLAGGLTQAIAASSAHVVYVCNRTTKLGETHDFTTVDFYTQLSHYLAPAQLHTMIIDDCSIPVPTDMQAVPFADLPDSNIRIIRTDIANEHSPEYVSGEKVAQVIQRLWSSS